MASSWWPFWQFGQGASSSPATFLHLSRANIERIRELTSHEEPLNPHQCRSMSSKLSRNMRSIERMVDLVNDTSRIFGSSALENFYRVSEKGKQLVENCCSTNWCQASTFQIQNEEAFKEILLETSLCYNTICKVVEDMNQNKEFLFEDLRKTPTFDPPSVDEVFKDRVALQARLMGLVNDVNLSSNHIRSQYLGKYLLGRVNSAFRNSGGEDFDVRSFNLWSDGKGPDGEWSKESEYLGGNVCKTTWLDVPCAKKLFKDEMQEDEWLAEAKVLASLNHPNIVKFLCCNKYETAHSWGHFIAMEQMETSLGSFMRRLKEEGAKLSLFPALDIILQIAYGMCYLHDRGIAHRDLKTSNVVVRRITAPQLQSYLQAKVVDFGISKVNLQDKSNTITRPKIGTTTYMPPEAFSNGRANWFKADVYSFSVMCSVILSCNEPFQDIKRKDLCTAICSGRRPKLPGDIPTELALVVTEGWAADRNLRPSFYDICSRLEKLRHWLLRNHESSGLSLKQEEPESHSSSYIERMLKRRSEARERDRDHVRPQTATPYPVRPVLECDPYPVVECDPYPVVECDPYPVVECDPYPVVECDPYPVIERDRDHVRPQTATPYPVLGGVYEVC
jgi:serine/threonine protein kinase